MRKGKSKKGLFFTRCNYPCFEAMFFLNKIKSCDQIIPVMVFWPVPGPSPAFLEYFRPGFLPPRTGRKWR